jgi:hypothetical protein
MGEPVSIFQVNRHAGRSPDVTPDRRQKPRVPGSFGGRIRVRSQQSIEKSALDQVRATQNEDFPKWLGGQSPALILAEYFS